MRCSFRANVFSYPSSPGRIRAAYIEQSLPVGRLEAEEAGPAGASAVPRLRFFSANTNANGSWQENLSG